MSTRSLISSLLLSSLLLGAPTADAGLDGPHGDVSSGTGCLSCHQMTSTYPKLLPPLNHAPTDIDDTIANGLCWSCHNTPVPLECEGCHPSSSIPYVATHSSLTTSSKYGNWTVECWVCHNQHSQEQNTFNDSTYGKYIRRSINLANIKDENGNTFTDTVGATTGQAKAGTESIVFTGKTGSNSFADGDATVTGICEVCHTQTTTSGDNSRFSHEREHTGLQEEDCTRCHPHTLGFKPAYQCLDCHDDPENPETNITRADIKAQFQGKSHHVQRGDNGADPIENTDCYQCHWEADENGKVTTHHGATPDAVVDLVIYGAGTGDRPASYNIGTTAVAYAADGSREQIISLNDHCLSCHDDDSQGNDIFNDDKSPDYYAWDGESIEERYAQTGTARWGKYYNSGTDANAINAAEKDITKAFSAHGNAANNFGGGYSTVTACFGPSITAQTCPDLGGSWNPDNGRCETISLPQCTQNFCQSLSQQSCANAAGAWGNTSSICKDISKKTCDTGYCYMHSGNYNDENDYNCYSRGGTYREGADGWICTDITPAQCSSLSGSTWVGMSGVWHVTASEYMQGLDYTLVPTRGGPSGKTVACFDCHNSHGSNVVGDSATDRTTSYASVTPSGGILKDTRSGKGGYGVTYQPKEGGDDTNKNKHKAGAALCLNCHLTSSDQAAERPWSYDGTFGASAPILGYFDSEYLAPGDAGPQKLYPYKALSENAGGHFAASRPLTASPMHEIDGICTPCHDPHGVSPSHVGVCDNPSYLTKPECIAGNGNWEARQDYGIPLLKGTWLTSPYREDAAPAATDLPAGFSGRNVRSDPGYHIDQNTFADWDFVFGDQPGEGIQEDINLFAGLCLQCHTNDGSTADIDPDSGDAWESMDRVHETVKGWGAGRKHNFSCSKCHTPHNGSALPRLMVTNCLNFRHRGQVASGGVPHSGNYQSSGQDGDGAGSGKFPGGGTGAGGGWGFGPFNFKYAFGGVDCHDTVNGGTWPDNQNWNIVTPWTDLAPSLSSPTATGITTASAFLGAKVLPDSGWSIIDRGTVWGATTNPTANAEAEGEETAGIFSHQRTGLPPGSKIFYRGYATNNFGTGYSPEGTFYTEPEFQASAIDFPVVSATGMTVSWTRNVSGNGVIVLMKQGSAVDSHPQDGTYSGYTGNQIFGTGTELGNGNYVVFKGDGTFVDVTGLYPGTTYHVAVYEYAGAENASEVNKGTNYKLPPETNYAKTTDAAPVLIASTAASITSATAILGAEVVSVGGQAISERGTVWGIAQNPEYPSANALPTAGTTGIYSHERTGLDPGAKIYYRGYAINSEGVGYSPEGSFYTEPDIQASGVNFTPTGDTEATVTWSRGNGNGVIVLMKMGSPVDSPPEDGKYTAYSGSSVFGMGSEVGGAGSGNFVVHKGTGSGITVSGLYLGMTYHVAVYEYAGTIDTSGADQGTNYRQHDAQRANGTLGIPPGTYTYTFNATGSAKAVYIPATATNIQFTVKGAGGGGGRFDDYQDHQNGLPGHSVVSPSTLTDVVVTVYVADGGKAALDTEAGAPGGWGKPPGQPGGNGDNAYGGAGGGGASAIYNGTTRLVEAAGGRGGDSAGWEEEVGGDYVIYSAGGGGAGGGADYGGTANTTGGGAGGIKSWSYTSNPTDGGDGLVEITFTIP